MCIRVRNYPIEPQGMTLDNRHATHDSRFRGHNAHSFGHTPPFVAPASASKKVIFSGFFHMQST